MTTFPAAPRVGIPVHLRATGCRVGALLRPPVTWPHGWKYVWHVEDENQAPIVTWAGPIRTSRARIAERVRLPDPETDLDRYVLLVERADELVGVPGFVLDS